MLFLALRRIRSACPRTVAKYQKLCIQDRISQAGDVCKVVRLPILGSPPILIAYSKGIVTIQNPFEYERNIFISFASHAPDSPNELHRFPMTVPPVFLCSKSRKAFTVVQQLRELHELIRFSSSRQISINLQELTWKIIQVKYPPVR